jgi:hypothetical protein
MTDELADFYVHTAASEAYLGTNGDGADLYAAAVDVDGWWEGVTKLILNSDGEQVLALGVFRTNPANASSFPLLARVTVAGTTGRVERVSTFTSGALGLPDHIEIALT